MLSGEGNAEERWKTTIGLISEKKATLHVQLTYFVYFFAVVLHETTRNFFNSCTFYGGNVVRVLYCRSFSSYIGGP